MRGVTSISITLLIIISSMAGCIEALEEVTEVLGCTDEGADNFDADATSGLEELCLYLENEVRFIAAMTDAMAADPSSYLLDPTSGVSGVQYSMSMDGVDAESGMSVSMELLSVIMVDLESQSMYNRSRVSYMGMLDVDTEIVMSGTDIMVTNSLGGPMASELGGSGSVSSISRDMTPNLEEAVRVASTGFSSIMGMEDMMMLGEMGSDEEDDHRDDADESDDEEPDWEDFEPYCYDRDGEMVVQTWDSDDSQQTMERECYEMGYEWVYSQEMEDDLHEDYGSVPTEGMLPEGASVVISHDPEAGLQSMFANSTDENGVMTMVIRLHEDGSFHSYDMTVDGHDADVSMSFAYLSFDVISIPEIDFSMDRTATPIFTEVETMMVCDDGASCPNGQSWMGGKTVKMAQTSRMRSQRMMTTAPMKRMTCIGSRILAGIVNGRATQTMSTRTGGPVRRTYPFQSGITGGSTVRTTMRIGSVRMNTDKIQPMSSQQIVGTTTKAMPRGRIRAMWMASIGSCTPVGTVNGRATQMTSTRTGGPAKEQSGITGGTTVRTTMGIGSVRMATGRTPITSSQQTMTITMQSVMMMRRIASRRMRMVWFTTTVTKTRTIGDTL